MTQYMPEGEGDPLPDWMTKQPEVDSMKVQQTIEREFDHRTMVARTRVGLWTFTFLVVALLFCVTLRVYAQTTGPCANLKWDEDCVVWNAPIARTDGSALAATDIASYTLERAPGGSATWSPLATVNAPQQAYRYGGLKNGNVFQYRVFVTLKSGVSSVPSDVKSVTTVEPPPTAPTITVDTVAFEIKPNSTGVLAATRVGLVPLGTTCSSRQQKVGTVTYSLVPRAAVDMVNWPTNAKLQDVWAKCG